MALSGSLARAGNPPQRLEVTSQVTFDQIDGNWTVVSSKLTVHGRVQGLDAEQFAAAAEQAKANCPISRALAGNVALTVEAVLDLP
jgi:osmotically inducible protein OsmC